MPVPHEIGHRVGKLTLIGRLPGKAIVRCDCGKEKILGYSWLSTKSCGCTRPTRDPAPLLQDDATSNRAWVARYPLKVAAALLVQREIRAGRLCREPCVVCGALKTDGHHPDYAKPLEVMWLCRVHHLQWHAENGPGRNGGEMLQRRKQRGEEQRVSSMFGNVFGPHALARLERDIREEIAAEFGFEPTPIIDMRGLRYSEECGDSAATTVPFEPLGDIPESLCARRPRPKKRRAKKPAAQRKAA